jgi:hypothetical protein
VFIFWAHRWIIGVSPLRLIAHAGASNPVSSPFALWAGPRIEVAPFRLSGTVYATLAQPSPLARRRSAMRSRRRRTRARRRRRSSPSSRARRSSLPAAIVQINDDAEALEVGAALGS